MNDVDGPDTRWRRAVDKIIRGERPARDYLDIVATPSLLIEFGFSAGPMVITPGKLARCRREHPEVALIELYSLPEMLCDPVAIFPSRKNDGTQILVLIVEGVNGQPIIAAALPGLGVGPNVILSIYGKSAGLEWIWRQIDAAKRANERNWVRKDFAATQQQPENAPEGANASPSGPIPAGGAAKPIRQILSIGKKVKNPGTEAD